MQPQEPKKSQDKESPEPVSTPTSDMPSMPPSSSAPTQPGAPEVPAAQDPQMPTPPQPAPTQTTATPPQAQDPGHTMGVVGLVLAFVGMQFIGLIVSIIARSKSKKAGFKNTLATIGIVINAIFLVLGILWLILIVFVTSSGLNNATKDTEATTDINNQHAQLESFYYTNKYYPASMNEVTAINQDTITAPEGYTYTYTPSPDGCTQCSDYTLETKLSDGTYYTKTAIK